MSKGRRSGNSVLLWIIRILIVILFCVSVAIAADRLVEYHQKNKADVSMERVEALCRYEENTH